MGVDLLLALIFALAMDYTCSVELGQGRVRALGRRAHRALEGLARRQGDLINAAGGVMVVVFFTFALSGPLAPKEMGVIPGVPSCSTRC
jgi:RND superfamily putative drug exporter